MFHLIVIFCKGQTWDDCEMLFDGDVCGYTVAWDEVSYRDLDGQFHLISDVPEDIKEFAISSSTND